MDYPKETPKYTFEYRLRSRYSETDKMGYVYYGHFLQFFEVARTEMIRSLGVSYAELENQGVMLPVVSAELEYKSPVFYDEEISIFVDVFDVPTIRLNTFYRVVSTETGQLKTLGKVVLVFMDEKTRKPMRGPVQFIKALEDVIALR
ncbi:acyl-CoA thioesterase [bacterium]|nr:MAG: acyl-CoA thioesterase [bacterium]